MLSVKQGGIKYHFLSLWYDSTWDWTQVSRAIGETKLKNTYIIFKDPKQNFENNKQATLIKPTNSNLQSSLLRCGTRPNERGAQWDSNSLV